jgi:hypothetical protein
MIEEEHMNQAHTIPGLARLRRDLVEAVARDRARARHRRRAALAATVAVVAVGAVGSAIAAATGTFPAAPRAVQQLFQDINDSGDASVDVTRAVRIGVIDDHAAYAAPTADDGFCLVFAAAQRSGPSDSRCTTAALSAVGDGEIALTTEVGSDGGFVFGRVADQSATTVVISVPNGGGRLTTPVAEQGLFLAKLSERALRALTIVSPRGQKDPPTKDGGPNESFDLTRIDAIAATAKDAQGAVVARGVNKPLPNPNEPTTTGAAGE